MRLMVWVTACPPVEPRCSRLALRRRPPEGLLSLESRSCLCGFAEVAYAALRGTKATTTSASKTAAMRRSNGRECRL
jgi:hypothetical protein